MVNRERKQAIREFMQKHYTDERLGELLAYAQDGKLVFKSCCCFIGVVTADHALQVRDDRPFVLASHHYSTAKLLPGALEAERAFLKLSTWGDDSLRRRVLIPMIKAEMKRRGNVRQGAAEKETDFAQIIDCLAAEDAEVLVG